MKTYNICNLKGGVGKTITAVNVACILAEKGHKVLLVDNDQQGNASQFFGAYGYDRPGTAEILGRKANIRECVQHTKFEGLDIVPSNLNLAGAERELSAICGVPREQILKKALSEVAAEYDFCIIDNAPSLSIAVINALVAGDFVLVPTKADRFTFEGVASLLATVRDVREFWNPGLKFLGCLVTMYRRNEVNIQGAAYLKACEYPIMETYIRYSEKVNESTFGSEAITTYSQRSGPAKDYRALVKELLKEEV